MDRLTTGVIQSNRRRQDSDTKAKMRRLLRRVRQLEEQTLVGHLCRKAADKAEREQRIADTKALRTPDGVSKSEFYSSVVAVMEAICAHPRYKITAPVYDNESILRAASQFAGLKPEC
ncbi:hypothetical protein PC120_g21908 [Phytophthora cactorum]|nr:hypothetical protein PC120_g21908 [Phytophthora cactorum]